MTTTWRPPPDLAEQVREAAFRLRRSANDIVNEAVRDWLAAKGHTATNQAGRGQ